MEPTFSVTGRIAKPVRDVFEAVAAPETLSEYFTTGGAQGRLETGATVTWDFHDFPGAFPVEIVEVEQDRRIVLRWSAPEGTAPGDGKTTVTMTFEPVDDDTRTLVRIAERGWSAEEAGVVASYRNCEGWTGMLAAMKVWLEHGVRLREGFYK